ncbi:MAG: hypothetical protein K0R12_551 [Gammaproteobacteria bacterium]|jgi:L,D-transpeptidase ErfK/SrfK|nr:hypothetical protein [Gammaproteobacteria bacterium]
MNARRSLRVIILKKQMISLFEGVFKSLILLSCCFISSPVLAKIYPLSEGDVVGNLYQIFPSTGVTMRSLVNYTDVGFEEIKAANPQLPPDLPSTRHPVTIPARFVLPNTAKKGVVINIAEFRLYYYPPQGKEVETYPIGIGRKGWDTPLGKTKIISKTDNPVWRVPESIRLDVATRLGVILPDEIPPGPKNPLGTHAVYLGLRGYLIHGTNAPYGVGERVSSGCIRLSPEDIITFYNEVNKGTPVQIINEPYKVGFSDGKLYLEAHPNPEEYEAEEAHYLTQMKKTIREYAKKHHVEVNWDEVSQITKEQLGIPEVISTT